MRALNHDANNPFSLSPEQIASGLLLSSFDAHYRSILTLTFSPTSQLLISSSEDSSTFVWSVTRLVDNDPRLMNALPEPWGALEGHSLAVVCVGVGKGGGPAGVEGRVWTGSMDGTVKVRRRFINTSARDLVY